jgi:transposase-like protein
MGAKRGNVPTVGDSPAAPPDLSRFSCPNPDCVHFQKFGQGNLRVGERMGKDKRLLRLVCRACQTRFSELQGSLLEYSKLPEEKVVRIVKCLTWGNSVEATADICEVDPRTVQRIVERGGERARRFHDQKVRDLQTPQVQIDEVHGGGGKKEGPRGSLGLHRLGRFFSALVGRFGRRS